MPVRLIGDVIVSFQHLCNVVCCHSLRVNACVHQPDDISSEMRVI